MPISDHAHPKITEITFSFPEYALACKNSIHSIYSFLGYSLMLESCDQTGHTHFWLYPPKRFSSTFNLYEFISTSKTSGYFIHLFWRNGWLKNHTHVKSWGTPQNFFFAFIDELEKQIIIKDCWRGPIKNKIILVFTMLYFCKKNKERKTPVDIINKILMIWSTVPEI